MRKLLSVGVALTLGLTACGPVASQHTLDEFRAKCAAGGPSYCNNIPNLEYQVSLEKQEQSAQAAAFAVGALGLLGAVAVGVSAASQPVYVCRWNCW